MQVFLNISTNSVLNVVISSLDVISFNWDKNPVKSSLLDPLEKTEGLNDLPQTTLLGRTEAKT